MLDDLSRYRGMLRKIFRRPSPADVKKYWDDVKAPREIEICRRVHRFIGRTEFDKNWLRRVNPSAQYYHLDEVMRAEFYNVSRVASLIVPHSIYAGAAFSYPLKGGHRILRMVAALKSRYPDVTLRVANSLSVMDNSLMSRIKRNEYHSYISGLIGKLGLRDNVVCLPALSVNQVVTELLHANVFCLASYMENSPNSLKEAFLVGTPSVAFDVGGVVSIADAFAAKDVVVKNNDENLFIQKIARIFDGRVIGGCNKTFGDEPRQVARFLGEIYGDVKRECDDAKV